MPMPEWTNNSENITLLTHHSGPNWYPVTIFTTIASVGATVTNGAVMAVFFCHRDLWTSFNVYLINLVTTNFVFSVIHNPLDIINHLYSDWTLGWNTCTLYTYGQYVLKAGIRTGHVLITFNRIWAVLWPHSYRQLHTRKIACLTCLGAWVYVHMTILPGVILDALYYRKPLVMRPCSMNTDALWQWALATQLVVYNLPLLEMLLAYPVVWYKRRQRQKMVTPCAETQESYSMTSKARRPMASLPSHDEELDVSPRDTANSKTRWTANQRMRTSAKGQLGKATSAKSSSSNAFTILTVLTMSVTVCWGPNIVYYTVTVWVPFNSSVLINFGTVLFALQAVLDPILFVAALSDLREAFKAFVKSVLSC